MIVPLEAEPAARKACQATGPQTVDAAHLTDPRRARARHALDVTQRLERSIEEPPTEAVAALGPVVLASLDEVGLGEAGVAGPRSFGSAECPRTELVDELGSQGTTLA